MLMVGLSCFVVAAYMMFLEIGCYAFGIMILIIIMFTVIKRIG